MKLEKMKWVSFYKGVLYPEGLSKLGFFKPEAIDPLLFLCLFSILAFGCAEKAQTPPPNQPPNIVIIYVDDLGYGDLESYGAQGVSTPAVDKMAANGIRFTDAHSAAATCTPSRYALLTGEFAFRRQAKVLKGDAPLLIEPNSYTLPSMLKKAGYRTGVVGKWHLGLGDGNVDWNAAVKPGPLEVGFDYAFLLPATGDRVPCVYLENHHIVALDTADPIQVSYEEPLRERLIASENPEAVRYLGDPQHSNTIVNGVGRIGYMSGGESALWVDEDFPNIFTQKAKDFITASQNAPFFLFFSLHDIHVPRLPAERFQGKSSMGLRGDAIAQMDWMSGEIIKQLEALHLDQETLVIFTSDNGPVLNDGYEDQAVELLGKHDPAGGYRGGKYSAYEAGTRVPMIAYWPGHIQAGVSSALINQTDLYASIASLLQKPLAHNEAMDSQDVLPALLKAEKAGTEYLLEESFTLSLRQGDWKYIEPSTNSGAWIAGKGIEGGLQPEAQLYDLSQDPSEQSNLAPQQPERVKSMQAKIDEIRLQKTR
ncbi:MAG: arylsulfatase [Bacteroidota bacterium]